MDGDATADRLAIMDQLYRYCRSVDRLDVPLGHAVFHPDATARFPDFEGSGHGWIDHICVEHLKFLHHSHQVTNVIIDLDGDRAASESYVLATLRADEDGRLVQRQFWARYVDAWSKRDGRWAIDARECVVDFSAIGEVTPIEMPSPARRDRQDPSYRLLKDA
jgi:hypothetical protein